MRQFLYVFVLFYMFRWGAAEGECGGVECPSGSNPDEDLNTVQIARRHGYPAESHIIATEDGYILTMHRIPGSKNGQKGDQPVLLQHGLLSSSTDWVISGNNSLAFMLADAGFDVWMGNARGNVYSTAHVNLSIHSPQFWNFSWHEMAIYDLPAVIYHISNTTNKPGEILYVGHSMGTTMFFAFSSLKLQAAKNIKKMVALAPVAYMTHITAPIRYLAPFSGDFLWISKYLGLNDFLPRNEVFKVLSIECKITNYSSKVCDNLFFVLFGFNRAEISDDSLPVIFSHDPAGTSTRTVIHYAQEIKAGGRFQRFDYGPAGNMEKYGVPTPPPYKLENIKVPVYLMYSMADRLSSYIDVLRLSGELRNRLGIYRVPEATFDHIDYLFGKNAPDLVYKPLMKVLQNTSVDYDYVNE